MNAQTSGSLFPRAGAAQTARDVQSRLFPCRLPLIQGLDYYGECRPARDVGGDFHDFVPFEPHALAVSVGDVSGHGPGAGILMSGLQALLRGLTTNGRNQIGRVVRELNHAAWQASPGNFYATLFYAYLDPVRGRLQYVSAGHESALLIRRRKARVHRLDSTGTVLGLTDRAMYGQRTLPLEPGDLLIAYTDGITGARNAEGGEFGEKGILQVVERCAGARACDVGAEILEAVDCYAAPEEHGDDRTAVVVRYKGAAEQNEFEVTGELALAAA
ncbi:MAG TPA: PP2C family protein-serine/threonine phosphatase [Bryobacteraceae bacterium]|nr:PP2C family protein-serine/threonine phosphatase [Bryobacteraceae bacterium]